MAIVFDENGKYVDEKGLVKLDPTKFADWQIAEEAEKSLPSVDFFREKLEPTQEEITQALAMICRQNNITMAQLQEYYDAEFEVAVMKSVLTSKVMHFIRDAADVTVVE